MAHNHSHSHGQHHIKPENKKALFWSFILIFTYMLIEFIGGLLTNSLALLSDAGHMLSDAAALGLSLFAFMIGTRDPNQHKTYGYRRFEILAAFINGLTLIAIAIFIVIEGVQRFYEPPEVSPSMIIIASIGLIINIAVAWILMQGERNNLNLRSAFLHVLGDLLGSIGAITAGFLIYFFNWNIADPIASIIVAFLVLISGIRVTRESYHVLMEGKPEHIPLKKLKDALHELPQVCDVHDLHVWSITPDFPAMSCHMVVEPDSDRDQILKEANQMLKEKFHIEHTTIQMEGKELGLHHKDDCCN
ncbi:MAG: cation transporter [Bacillaceae bacterium]|nr:cation transporter [Bacillaceae bacterium]